jgi:hypothetical protein
MADLPPADGRPDARAVLALRERYGTDTGA